MFERSLTVSVGFSLVRYSVRDSGQVTTVCKARFRMYEIGCFHTRDGLSIRQMSHLQNPSKLMDKQIYKVRWIIHPKLKLLHFCIKTYLFDVNYPMDKTISDG